MITSNAVIGFPLEHTNSPVLHGLAYKDLGLVAQMQAIAGEDIAQHVSRIRQEGTPLTAVTMPHKQSIMPLLDEISPEAKAIGAVNTVVNKEGTLTGHNTDITGIRFALRTFPLKGKRIMMLGAGGAARPLAFLAQQEGAELFIWNRSPQRAQELAAEFGATAVQEPVKADLLVNMTPVGMHPHEDNCPIRPEIIEWYSAVFDVVYNPRETKLLKLAKDHGLQSFSGLDMFVAQAMEQIRLWTGSNLDPNNYLNFLDK